MYMRYRCINILINYLFKRILWRYEEIGYFRDINAANIIDKCANSAIGLFLVLYKISAFRYFFQQFFDFADFLYKIVQTATNSAKYYLKLTI